MQDDAPNKIKNNRRDAVSDAREVDARQLHLRDKRRSDAASFFLFFSPGLDRRDIYCLAGDTHMSVIQERQDLGNVI